MQAAVQAQDVKMIENWSLWEHTTKGNRSKEKLIKHDCEEAQNKSMWLTLLHQACIIALFQNWLGSQMCSGFGSLLFCICEPSPKTYTVQSFRMLLKHIL